MMPTDADVAARQLVDAHTVIGTLKVEVHGLRKLLWLTHTCMESGNFLYGDDGEMQCGSCFVDFKRASLDTLFAHVRGPWSRTTGGSRIRAFGQVDAASNVKNGHAG